MSAGLSSDIWSLACTMIEVRSFNFLFHDDLVFEAFMQCSPFLRFNILTVYVFVKFFSSCTLVSHHTGNWDPMWLCFVWLKMYTHLFRQVIVDRRLLTPSYLSIYFFFSLFLLLHSVVSWGSKLFLFSFLYYFCCSFPSLEY